MVQKALLLGVGLQHRSVDDLALELNLPASQVKHQARISTQHSSEKRIPDPLQHSGRQSDKGRSFARGLMTIQKKHHLSSLRAVRVWGRVCDFFSAPCEE
jgi:hypothetical protein